MVGRFGFGLVWSIGFISFLVCKENGIKAANMEFFFGYCIHKKGGLIWIYDGTGKRTAYWHHRHHHRWFKWVGSLDLVWNQNQIDTNTLATVSS